MLKIFKNSEGKELAVNSDYVKMVMPSPFTDQNCLLYVEGNGNHIVVPYPFKTFVKFINNSDEVMK